MLNEVFPTAVGPAIIKRCFGVDIYNTKVATDFTDDADFFVLNGFIIAGYTDVK